MSSSWEDVGVAVASMVLATFSMFDKPENVFLITFTGAPCFPISAIASPNSPTVEANFCRIPATLSTLDDGIFNAATVEALRHINIHGEIAVEHGQNNSFTNVMQQIARDELVRLNYGYVLELPRNIEEFMYEPINQVRVVDRRRDGSRRGRSAQGGRRHVISPPFNLNDELPIEAYDDPHNAPLPTQDDLDRDNEMGDISQQDVIQQVMTPYDNQLHMYCEGSSSQVTPHGQRPIRTPSNHMTNYPFPHPIQNYITDEDSTINTSQVVNPTQPQGARGDIIYQRRRPVRNRRPPPCGTE
nr:hypothetical protein Itr_chr12CG14060 [Ipomoea trifida]